MTDDDNAELAPPPGTPGGKYGRAALNVVGGLVPFVGGVFSAGASIWSEVEQEKATRSFKHQIQMLWAKDSEKQRSIIGIEQRLGLHDEAIDGLVATAALQQGSADDRHARIAVVRKNAPVNILEVIGVGVPRARVEEILGVPSLILGGNLYYTYDDIQAEIQFGQHDAVDQVIVALCRGHTYSGLSALGITEIPLGHLTLRDLLQGYPGLDVQHSFSARTEEVFVRGRMGTGMAWTEYCFGALSVASEVGRLQETRFEWDYQLQQLSTDAREILINYMAVPGPHEGPPGFAWYID